MDKNAGNPFVYDGFDKLSHQNRTKVKKRVFFQYIDSISVSSVCHNFFFPQSFLPSISSLLLQETPLFH